MAGFIDLRRNVRDDMAIAQNIGGNIGYALGARSAYKQQQEQQQIAKERKQTIEQGLIRVMADPSLTPRQRREEAMKIPNIVDTKIGQNIMTQQFSEPKTETEGQLVNDIVRLTNAADKTNDPAQLQFFTDMIYQKQQKVQALRGPGYKPHISDEQLKSDIDTAVLSAKDAKWGKHDYSKQNLLNAWNGIVEKYDLNNNTELYKRVKDKWNETIRTKKDPGEYDWDPNEIGAMPTIPAARNWTSQMGLDMFTPGEKVTTPNGTEIGNYDQAGKIILNDAGLQWLVSYGKANNLTKEQTLQFAKENNWIVK